MQVLIVSTYFAPEVAGNAPYVAAVAHHLAAQGHEVNVLAGDPHYPEWRRPAGYARVPWVCDGAVTIQRRRHYVPRSPTMVRRAIYEGSLLSTGLAARIRMRRPDVILAFSPALSDAILGLALSRRTSSPLALVFQDLFGVGAVEVGGHDRVGSVLLRLERALAGRASAVGIVAEAFRRHLDPSGSLPIHRLHNWSRLATPTATSQDTRRRWGWGQQEIIVVHGGNIGEKQGLEVVVEVARTEPLMRFVFIGDGNRRSSLEARASSLGLSNVQFIGVQPDDQYANVLSAADALLLVQSDSVREMSLPSKLQTYLAVGLPIVASVARASEAARVVVESGRGIVVDPGSPSAIAAGVRQVLEVAESGVACQHAPEAPLEGYERLLETALRGETLEPSGSDA
jgi:colanic acid biosynthesis glycosyl transferase WcaI